MYVSQSLQVSVRQLPDDGSVEARPHHLFVGPSLPTNQVFKTLASCLYISYTVVAKHLCFVAHNISTSIIYVFAAGVNKVIVLIRC